MLTLVLWNTAETSQHVIELYENAPVNLTYQFNDITEVAKPRASYSQTFRVPATKKNREFFGSIDSPAVATDSNDLILGNYSVKKKIRAELRWQTIPLIKGNVQVRKVYIQKKDFAEIELCLFGEVLDLARECADKKLTDLTTTSLNHTLSQLNLTASWLSLLKSGNVVYGVIDKGRNWDNTTSTDAPWPVDRNFATSDNPLVQSDFTPFIRLKWLFEKIITEAGFTISSTFLDSTDFMNMFVPAYNGAIAPVSDDNEIGEHFFAAGLAADYAVTTTYTTVPLEDNVGGAFDYGGNFDNTTHKFTIPYDGWYHFQFAVGDDGAWSDYPGYIRMVKEDASGTITQTAIVVQPSVTTDDYGFFEAGEKVYLQAKELTNPPDVMVLNSGYVGNTDTTWMRLVNQSEPWSGQSVDIQANLPDIMQIDFLKSVQQMFNLVIVNDKYKPNHLIIEPYVDYMSTGTQKEWTDKVDYTKDVIIEPTTNLQKREYEWNHGEGMDFINTLIKESTGRVYGRFKVEDPDNDFATGTNNIQSNFQNYLISNIPGTSIPIHRQLDKDGNGVQEPKPMVAYWNGLKTSYGTIHYRNDSNVVTSGAYFPHFSNYNSHQPDVADNDLNYGYEQPFIWIASHPLNTLYYRYWMNYVNELYSDDARVVTLYVNLSRDDISNFEFSDKVFIKDTNYRVLKIENYDATSGGIVKVQLIKILGDVSDCADKPTGQLSSGVITFNGSSTDYGSQQCCERYGYTWVVRKSGGTPQCYPASIATPPQIS